MGKGPSSGRRRYAKARQHPGPCEWQIMNARKLSFEPRASTASAAVPDVGARVRFPGQSRPLLGTSPGNWIVNEKKIAPHIPVIDKSKREDGSPVGSTQSSGFLIELDRVDCRAWDFDRVSTWLWRHTVISTANRGCNAHLIL
jgi:hypothetical protein